MKVIGFLFLSVFLVNAAEAANPVVEDVTVDPKIVEKGKSITIRATAFTREGRELVEDLPGGATMEFVWIDAGTFVMGDTLKGSDESPSHQVTISQEFYLGKYEITQAQWEAVMGTTPWVEKDNVQTDPNHPAVYISWEEVQGFIDALNVAAGDALYRLPTEAEWEYACQAGTTTRWSFGDDEDQLGEYAWYKKNALDKKLDYAQPVGTRQKNPWGLYDMHGNVWEWCQDWIGNYTSDIQTDPTGPVTGTYCVTRGGGFFGEAQSTRSANRGSNRKPSDHLFGIGARLLRIKK